MGFPGGSVVNISPAGTGDEGDPCVCSIPGLGRSPGGGNGNLLQHLCLGNPMNESMEPQRVRHDNKCFDTILENQMQHSIYVEAIVVVNQV